MYIINAPHTAAVFFCRAASVARDLVRMLAVSPRVAAAAFAGRIGADLPVVAARVAVVVFAALARML